MALYIDSAFLSDIIPVAQTLPLAVATTNSSILFADQERGQKLEMLSLLHELQRIVEGFIFVQSSFVQNWQKMKNL